MRYFRYALALVLAGCASTPNLTPNERLVVQSRIFKGVPKRLVLRSMVSVLQTEGYLIKREDPEHGVIVGAKPVAVPAAGTMRRKRLLANETVEVALQAIEPYPGTLDTRVSVQRLSTDSFGEQEGQEVMSLPVYRSIFGKLRAEVARRAREGLDMWNAAPPAPRVIEPRRRGSSRR